MPTTVPPDRDETLPRQDAGVTRPALEETGLHDLGDLWTDLGGGD
ncbi:MAG TPA: hypothetical protein VH092_39010 [Urbifossiella sp.]|jgi:hypothetical protein|nr:hypothetical protein [Urbifossiella sp.]